MHRAQLFCLVSLASAIPTPQQLPDLLNLGEDIADVTPAVAALPGTLLVGLPDQIIDMAGAKQAAHVLYSSISSKTVNSADIGPIVSQIFLAVQPTSTPTSIPDLRDVVASTLGLKEGESVQDTENGETSEDFFANALGLVLNGIKPSNLESVVAAFTPGGINSLTNVNPDPPAGSKCIYPQAGPSDAPYSLSEKELREAIYIPPTFTYGKKLPITLISGTGVEAGNLYPVNLGKLLAADDRFDPVYVNVPGNNLKEIPIQAEYTAYAANYISALTNRKTAYITWSQGSLDAQWAFKYWPSVVDSVTDSINVSPDYHGTIEAYLLCNEVMNPLACNPSIIQQDYESNFVHKLAENNGNSAYVPTTTIYSAFDEIVQPQEGTIASGFVQDVRGVGVSNNFLQERCAGEPAAGIYTHEGVLYNPLTYALVVDALTHDGPGSFERVGKAPCQDITAPGLSLDDVLATEATIPLALINIITFPEKLYVEPALPAYATY